MNPSLTSREIQVLKLANAGDTRQQIGEKLFVNKRTVDFYLTHVYKKLDVHDRIEAYWRSQELGLFSEEPQAEQRE